MSQFNMGLQPTHFLNPVYDRAFPDPFILKHLSEYWAYSTGFWDDGRCFGLLRSRDLIHWTEMPGAMEPLRGGFTEDWAPEVVYRGGLFLMYYSVGDGVRMEIRVALAANPEGPFEDSGRRLTQEDFAIDPHVYEDEKGNTFLFYATDFLARSRIGT